MLIKTYKNEDPKIPWGQLAEILHQSFKEHSDAGVFFYIANFSELDLRKKMGDGIVLISYDNERIAGFGLFTIRQDNNGYVQLVAISSDYKRRGIGGFLMNKIINIAKNLNMSYILSDTSFDAKSSMSYHKKMGFLKYSVLSSSHSNYYTCLFKYPLNKNTLRNTKFYIRLHFIYYYVKCHLLKKADGSKRFKKSCN